MSASDIEKKFITVSERKTGYQTQKTHSTYREVFDHGHSLLKKGDMKGAAKEFNFLLDEEPEDLLVMYFISAIELHYKHLSHAMLIMDRVVELHEKAIEEKSGKELSPKNYASLLNNIGFVYTNRQEKEKAAEYFKKALRLKKNDPDLLSNLGSLCINEGNPDKGIYYLKKCLDRDPTHPHAAWNMGLCYLEKGLFGKGFDLYEAGFQTGDRIERQFGKDKTPFWDGSPGKTVVVYGEQGLGDEIMFSSILPELSKKCRVIFECHPRLVNIFRNSFDFTVYGTRKAKGITWPNIEKFDAKLSIASLGKYFRRKPQDFPAIGQYLNPDEELKKHYKEKLDSLGDKLKIGISWEGGIAKTASSYRSIPLDDWKDILGQDATFINLQYTPDSDIEADKHGLVTWQEAIDDYDHTAALVSNLDLVISVCTSVIHLAGALDVPCWCLTPNKPAWRYGVKGKMYWYESVKLYRQVGDWPLSKIKDDLCSLLTNTKNSTPNSISPTMSTGQVECDGLKTLPTCAKQ